MPLMRAFLETHLWAHRLDQRKPYKSCWLPSRLAQVVTSTQVLNELRLVLRSKLQPPLPDFQISALFATLIGFEVVGMNPACA
jgi:predicted nucleic acid-binding protein